MVVTAQISETNRFYRGQNAFFFHCLEVERNTSVSLRKCFPSPPPPPPKKKIRWFYVLNKPFPIYWNSNVASRLGEIKQKKLIIHPSISLWFLLFYFPKPRSQVRILIYRKWSIDLVVVQVKRIRNWICASRQACDQVTHVLGLAK